MSRKAGVKTSTNTSVLRATAAVSVVIAAAKQDAAHRSMHARRGTAAFQMPPPPAGHDRMDTHASATAAELGRRGGKNSSYHVRIPNALGEPGGGNSAAAYDTLDPSMPQRCSLTHRGDPYELISRTRRKYAADLALLPRPAGGTRSQCTSALHDRWQVRGSLETRHSKMCI